MDKLYEQSETGCCPRFNPEPWDEKKVTWQDNLLLKTMSGVFLTSLWALGK